MLWTAPPPVGAVRAPNDSEEPCHADDHDHRSRYREVGLPGARNRRARNCCPAPSIEAPVRPGLLPEAAAVPDWYRSLCLVASLVTRAPSARPYRSTDATRVCEALREAAEERCHRCRGNLRGGYQAEHAVRRD